jgi:signal transduction histidine kinase
VYQNANLVHFKYRLLKSGSGDTTWYYTTDAQRDIQFNALQPGSYAIEIQAAQNNRIISTAPLLYLVTINQPWYNTGWFYMAAVLAIAGLFFALYQYRLHQALKIETVRRKISGDLHDDIGSTLSSINVYSQLAKTGAKDNEYINTIQTNAVEIINSLDDLVWNINPRNDTLEQLLLRMQLFALPLVQQKGMECVFKIKAAGTGEIIPPDTRANIYLLFKEMINNTVKHSGGTACHVNFIQKGNIFRLSVKDNGRGFDPDSINRRRNGLNNMQQRAKDVRGKLTIKSSPGNGTEITVDGYIKLPFFRRGKIT